MKTNMEEQTIEINVKHPGLLEVPDGKNVDDLPMSHFEKLVQKNGLSKITRALNNIQVWNTNRNPKLSRWAHNMINKLKKKYDTETDESLIESNPIKLHINEDVNSNKYRVWYNPYDSDTTEEESINITADSVQDARVIGGNYGFVTEIEVIED